MNYETLQIEQRDGALVVLLNRPQALNALNQQMMRELYHFFTEGYNGYEGIKGIVLSGAGDKAFAAGADIKEFLALDAVGGRDMAAFGHQVFFAIERFHMPVVAAVHGFALGGGCELAMSCHIRIASHEAKFGQPEVNLGLIPGYGGTQRLVHLIGKSRALYLLTTSEMIGAEEALHYGLVVKTAPKEQLMDTAISIVEKIGTKAPLAISKIITCVNASMTDAFHVEVEAFGECTGTEDFQEGARAFIEKRKPNFQGK